MNVKCVKLNRKYNLGNYETLDVQYEAELTELEGADSQQVLQATQRLERLCDEYYTAGRWQNQTEKLQDKPQPEKKNGVVVDLSNIQWETQAPTAKGEWEKSVNTPLDYFEIKKLIESKQAEGKAGFVSMEGYTLWMLKDGSLGRRKK